MRCLGDDGQRFREIISFRGRSGGDSIASISCISPLKWAWEENWTQHKLWLHREHRPWPRITVARCNSKRRPSLLGLHPQSPYGVWRQNLSRPPSRRPDERSCFCRRQSSEVCMASQKMASWYWVSIWIKTSLELTLDIWRPLISILPKGKKLAAWTVSELRKFSNRSPPRFLHVRWVTLKEWLIPFAQKVKDEGPEDTRNVLSVESLFF